jgi:hypothetical protein
MARIIVAPRDECELLQQDQGAYVNVLTLAANEMECRAKVANAMKDYYFDIVAIEDVFLFSDASKISAELTTIADELEESQNPKHVRFETLHTFPRVM